jgi:hypothetical protein
MRMRMYTNPALVGRKPDWSDLSRRDYRTKPGVLTPGINSNVEPALKGRQNRDSKFVRSRRVWVSTAISIAPLGRAVFDRSPGLKPRAESSNPFGINPQEGFSPHQRWVKKAPESAEDL